MTRARAVLPLTSLAAASLCAMVACGTPPDEPTACTIDYLNVDLDGHPSQLAPGQTLTLSYTLHSSGSCDAQELHPTWASSSPSLVSVQAGTAPTATITALAPTVTPNFVSISVGVHNSSSSEHVIVAPGSPASIAIFPSNLVIGIGSTQQLSVELRDVGGFLTTGNPSAFAWSVAAPSVSSVSTTGLVTALTPGTTAVTATYSGVMPALVGATSVTVTAAPAASISVTPSSPSIQVGGTVPLVAVVKDAQGNALTGRAVTWQSLTPGIATVGATTGIVTGVALGGPVTIRARADENQAISGDALVSVVSCPNREVFTEAFSADPGPAWTISSTTTNQFLTQTMTWQAAAGNPGGFRQMAHSMIGTGTLNVYHRREAEYHPSLPGNAIASINYSEDQIQLLLPSPGTLVGWGFFLEQGGNRYTKSIGTASYSSTTWAANGIVKMTAADFPGVNFGATGGKIRFGFYRANTSTGGIYTITHGIDNWSVEVCKQ